VLKYVINLNALFTSGGRSIAELKSAKPKKKRNAKLLPRKRRKRRVKARNQPTEVRAH
jgi:hypothetical protein